MPRLLVAMAYMCIAAFGLLPCLTRLEEIPGDFPHDIAYKGEGGTSEVNSLRDHMAYMLEVNNVLTRIADHPELASTYVAGGDDTALLVAQTARSAMIVRDMNSQPEGLSNADLFDDKLSARWAGAITSSPPLDTTTTAACSPGAEDAQQFWRATTMGYMDAIVRDGVALIWRTLEWAAQLKTDESMIEARCVSFLAEAMANALSTIVQVPVRYRVLKHRRSRPHEAVMAAIVSWVGGAGNYLINFVRKIDLSDVCAEVTKASSCVFHWAKLHANKGYEATATVLSATSHAMLSGFDYVASASFVPRVFSLAQALGKGMEPVTGKESAEGRQRLTSKIMQYTKVSGGPEPPPESTEAHLLFGAWV